MQATASQITQGVAPIPFPQPNTPKKVFYVDPISGSANGDGSLQKPWLSFQGMIAAGLINGEDPTKGAVHAGDAIFLMSGNHGFVKIANYKGSFNNTDYITITAMPGCLPVINGLDCENVSNWVFTGLTFTGSSLDSLAEFHGCKNIVFSGNQLYSKSDSTAWTPTDWKASAAQWGLYFDVTNGIVQNNMITNVRNGMMLSGGGNINCSDNRIDCFADDGIDFVVGDIWILRNSITNHYGLLPDGNHNDGIQGWTSLVPKNSNVIIDGNYVMPSTGKYSNIPMPSGSDGEVMQGISIFDGSWDNVLVSNNIVGSSAYHGLAMYGLTNSMVTNNTVIKQTKDTGMMVWLLVSKSSNVVVQNNLANWYNLDAGLGDNHNLSFGGNGYWSRPPETTFNKVVDPTTVFKVYDPANNKFDLHLKAGSPAIGAGVGGVDVGAYPFKINHAPSGSNLTIYCKSRQHVFATADFGFTDPDGDNLKSVIIVSVPVGGALVGAGFMVRAGTAIAAADITAGKLRFVAPMATTQAPAFVTGFTFLVQDDGGTENGGVDTDTVPRKITLQVPGT